ncbi:hypothetical protein [Aeromonas salmonicida]
MQLPQPGGGVAAKIEHQLLVACLDQGAVAAATDLGHRGAGAEQADPKDIVLGLRCGDGGILLCFDKAALGGLAGAGGKQTDQ